MISKLLLEKILNIDIKYLSEITEDNLLPYETSDGWKTINIEELAFKKCKKWALTHGYKINSIPDNLIGIYEAYINLDGTTSHSETSNTEEYAIFKLCQWLLDNKI